MSNKIFKYHAVTLTQYGIAFLLLFFVQLFIVPSIVEASCSSFSQDFNSCINSKPPGDPTANTVCTIAAGERCSTVERVNKPPRPERLEAAEPDPNQVTIPISQPAAPTEEQPPRVVPPPASATRTIPTAPVPVRPVAPPKPVITCSANGIGYFVGQKRYECANPRYRASCNADAGAGVPMVCNSRGEWDTRNNGNPECAAECSVTEEVNSCPMTSDTCFYSQKRDDGQGDVCFSGTGATNFNQKGCSFSCGPVPCEGLINLNRPQSQVDEPRAEQPRTFETEASPTPNRASKEADDEVCSGYLVSSCTEGNPQLITDWNLTPTQGDQSCNIFIRSGSGDHTLSNDCSGSWSGGSLPNGEEVVNEGSYELYISNGSETCLNKKVGETVSSCQTVAETDNRVAIVPGDPAGEGLFDQMVDVFTEILE